VEAAGEVDPEPVRQVPAVRELEREDRVARLQRREVDGHVGDGAGVRLHVRVLGAEELLRPVDRELLDLVDDLAAAVVALARIALGVLVRRHASDRLEHARPGEVLGGDQLDLAALPLELVTDEAGDLGIDLVEARVPQLFEGRLRCRHVEDATAARGARETGSSHRYESVMTGSGRRMIKRGSTSQRRAVPATGRWATA